MRLIRRIEALEQRVKSLEKPQPAVVLFDPTPEQLAESSAQNPGKKIVSIVTICCRECNDTCPSPGGPGCRKSLDEPARSWQPHEAANGEGGISCQGLHFETGSGGWKLRRITT